MSALELIGLVNQVLFVGLFVAVLWHAVRHPTRARTDTVLLFGSIALVVLLIRGFEVTGVGAEPWATGLILLLLNVAPYAMIRLVDDFSGTAHWIQVAGIVALVAIAVLSIASAGSGLAIIESVSVVWFTAVGGYAAVAFARQAGRTRGITQRRMAAVTVGAGLFIVTIVAALLAALSGGQNDAFNALIQVSTLASVLAFFLGFAPPAWVRRAWREPDLRRFLERSIRLTGVHDDRDAVIELQQAAADAFGAGGASIGILDAHRSILRYPSASGDWVEHPTDQFIGGQAFSGQRRVVAMNASRDDPDRAEVYERAGANTVIAAPINAEDRRIGVLTVYAERAPIFIEDDLWLIELLADQAAVLLEARSMTTHVSELRAREEAARLKEEFLSAAAHDLRTPLTVVLGQAELIERRLHRDPDAPVDAAGISRMAREARRLRDLVSELLDAQRLEQGLVVLNMAPTDLRAIVGAVRERHLEHGVPLSLLAPDEPVVASVDRPRIEQVVENLLENALKYGADDEAPSVRVWQEGDEARIAVIDHGAGIPEADRERIFERFYRAGNARSITDTGMGLGLFICRRIVDDHGGRIWAEPTPDGGTTFVVAVPLQRADAPGAEPEAEPASAPWQSNPGSGAVADA